MLTPHRVIPLLLLILVVPASASYETHFQLIELAIDAHSVEVTVDPGAPDAWASETARTDVENAIKSWGRYSLYEGANFGDLTITVCAHGELLRKLPQPRVSLPAGVGGRQPEEFCQSGDTMKVYAYRSSREPLWVYSVKDSLRHPSVPAVAAFRKAVEEAEKEEQKKQAKKQQKQNQQQNQRGQQPKNQP